MPKPDKPLTAAILSKLAPGEIARDARVRGFFAQAGLTDPPRVTLRAQADLKGPPVKTRKTTLGVWPALGIEDARARAMAWLAGVKQGKDPSKRAQPAPGQVTVAAMFQQCAEHMRTLGRAERSIDDLEAVRRRYLDHLSDRAVVDVKPSMLRAEHERISRNHGKVAANKAMRAYRSAFNVLLKVSDDPDALGSNPTRAVTFHPERRREAVIMPADLADWYERLQKLPNPLRRLMHELGLFSALRPGTLVAIERAWIRLDDRAIEIPRMKTGRAFALPLSEHMAGLVRRALVLSDELASGSPWLFPTRSADGREVKPTQVWRERSMPGETGHILRATHRTLAKDAGVDDVDADLLLDHKVPGIRGVYLRERALFDRLLRAQETVTAHMLGLLKPKAARRRR